MDPLTLALTAGGGLASLLGGRKELSLGDLENMFGAGALGNRAQQLFSILANSPSFRNAIGNTNLAGQRLGLGINANLAKAGLLNTGVGAIGGALGDAASGFATQGLVGGLHQTALDKASDLNSLLANLFMQSRHSGPTALQNLGGSLLGAGAHRLLGRRPVGGGNSAFSWTNEGEQQPEWG